MNRFSRRSLPFGAVPLAVLVVLFLSLPNPMVWADFSLADWRYTKHLSIPEEIKDAGLVELAVDREVFSGASRGLVDVRIIDEQIQEVARLGQQLEEIKGWPVDIEFAYADGQLYLLQCRPITTLDNHLLVQ